MHICYAHSLMSITHAVWAITIIQPPHRSYMWYVLSVKLQWPQLSMFEDACRYRWRKSRKEMRCSIVLKMTFSIPNWLLVYVILKRAAFRKKVLSGISKLVHKAKEYLRILSYSPLFRSVFCWILHHLARSMTSWTIKIKNGILR